VLRELAHPAGSGSATVGDVHADFLAKETTADGDPAPQTRFSIEAGLSQFLDCARWVSAFAVLLAHVNNRITVRLGGTIEGADLAQIAWGFVCGFGHHAVVVFFVLSGFLIGSNIIRDISTERFDAARYVIARVSRIHIVLVPAMLLTLVLDNVGSQLNSGIYQESQDGSFIGNVFMMQGFLTESFRSDGPLGTLANEFWYYLTFPLLALGFWKRNIFLLLVAAALLVPMTIAQPWHAVGFILWLIGAFVGSINPQNISRRVQWIILSCFLALLLAFRLGIRLEQYTPAVTAVTDIIVASTFALLLYALRRDPFFNLGGFADANRTFAGFSYSLYAVHAPIVMLICAASVYLTGFGWQSQVKTLWQWAIVAAAVAMPLALAYLFSRCTEARTAVVRAWLNGCHSRVLLALQAQLSAGGAHPPEQRG
jgi:peptidoglycan/LPS O-acetylase OafA/YrhL